MYKIMFSFLLVYYFNGVFGQNDITRSYKKLDKLIKANSTSITKTLNDKKFSSDTTELKALQIKLEKLDQIKDSLEKQVLLTDFKYIRKNSNKIKSLELISSKIWRQVSYNYCDSFLVLFDLLSNDLRQSELGIKTKKNLFNFKNSSVGQQAPDFLFTDINGKSFSISSLKDEKVLLIDFWASWCTPCRQDIPFLKKYIDTSKVYVIGISRDDDIENWKKAIVEEKISDWLQVSSKLNSREILDKYFIWAIPVKVLINKQGKIIGRWRGGGEETINDLLTTLKKELD
jgi:peroxiredoxin